MNQKFVYAEFKDGTIYSLNKATIEYDPNQKMDWWAGSKQITGHYDLNGTPYKQTKQEARVSDAGPGGIYTLTFYNNAPSVFFRESFMVGKIEFLVVSFNYETWKCVANGRLK